MSGKIAEDKLFEAEKRIKTAETIIGAMTEEERSNPDLIATLVLLIIIQVNQ